MQEKFLIGNWKTKLNLKESLDFTKKISKELKHFKNNQAELIICPPFVVLDEIKEIIHKTPMKLGAQNVFWANKGSYTGEITPEMLEETGCEYVIIGHSERRANVLESNEMVNSKVKIACQMENLTPIICIGETFEERREGRKDLVIIEQLEKAIKDVSVISNQNIIIGYEPIWVIGSGQTVDPEEAEYTHKVIRQKLIDTYPMEIVENNFRIIYGGSIDSSTIKAFIDQPTIDGVLVGGASVKEDEWLKMVKIICQNK
ncbi:MAG: triose-phosphate isomerase [Patescibacteria group bacterium]|nr:triose-phosphate isomerase [Patescibacteria group bacterium]